jgi:preprotein translocase subunit Sss1
MKPPPSRSPREAHLQVLRAETIGILIFVVVGFIIVLARYGRYLNWHAR